MTQFNYQKFFSKFPKINLGDIVLRDLALTDSQGYHELMQDTNVTQYLSDEDIPKNYEESVNEIKFWSSLFYKKRSVFWGIALESTDKLIGTIGFSSWNFYNKRAEISYELKSDFWRKGIMTKALTNALIFGFKNMQLNRIEARTMEHNTPSQNLLNKVGFKEEGVQRCYRIIRQSPYDIKLYSIIKKDFNSLLL